MKEKFEVMDRLTDNMAHTVRYLKTELYLTNYLRILMILKN